MQHQMLVMMVCYSVVWIGEDLSSTANCTEEGKGHFFYDASRKVNMGFVPVC